MVSVTEFTEVMVGGSGTAVMTIDAEPVPPEFVAVTVIVLTPTAVGVPVTLPFDVSIDSHAGRPEAPNDVGLPLAVIV